MKNYPSHDSLPSLHQSFGMRAAKFTLGLTLVGGASLLIGHEIAGDDSFLKTRINFGIDDLAQPSDDSAQWFRNLMNGSALVGGGALMAMGANISRGAINPRHGAIRKIAFTDRPGGPKKRAAAVSAIPVISAMMFGFSANIGDAVGGAQASALKPLVNGIPEHTVLISNSGNPELATTPVVANSTVTALFQAKEGVRYKDINLVPMRYSWESAVREKDSGSDKTISPKILSVVMSLPAEMTGLPQTDETCSQIPINAAPALGKIGDKIFMAGKKFVIAGHLDGSGPNTVPIAKNNETYAQCFVGNPDQPYNLVAIIAPKDKQNLVDQYIQDSGILNGNDGSVPKTSKLIDFIRETDRTSQNNSSGIIVIFAAAASIAAAGAIAFKTRGDLANSRPVNSMLSASGISNRDLKKIALAKADREALLASIYAMPLVAGMDYATAISTPGATGVAPNILTFLTVLGASTAVGRIATAAVMPSEVHKLNPARRGNQQ